MSNASETDGPDPGQSAEDINRVEFPENWNYEASVAEVEATIAEIEAGDLALEEVFEQFQSAVGKLKQCETFLTQRQTQVDLLIETLND